MKPALILIAFVCLITKMTAQPVESLQYPHNKELNKLNKVKELRVYGYGDKPDSGLLVAHLKYDTFGNILSTRSFTFNNKLVRFDTLIYNANHNLVKQVSYLDENKVNYDTMIYNENDSLIIRYDFSWDHSKATTNVEYTNPGKKIRNELYRGDTLISGSLTKYDSGNRILQQTYYGTNPAFIKADYLYDNEGRINQQILTSKSDVYTTTYKYNKANKLVSQFSDEKKNKSLFTYKYDSRGNMIEMVFNSAWENSITNHLSIFRYHSNNLLFETKSFVNNKQYWKEKRVYIFY